MGVSGRETEAKKGNLTAKVRTKDDVLGKEQDNEAGTRRDNDKVGHPKQDDDIVDTEQDIKMSIERDNNGIDIPGRDDEGAAKLAAGACTKVRKLLRRAFLIAARFNPFFIFLSSESMID